PEREGEHAAEVLDAIGAPRFPAVHDHFGVGLRAKHMAEGLELRNQFLIVVDLAVEDDDDGAVLVEERLLAGRDVDDREASMAERDARLEVLAVRVGSAMGLRVVHAPEDRPAQVTRAFRIDDSGYSTHDRSSRWEVTTIEI